MKVTENTEGSFSKLTKYLYDNLDESYKRRLGKNIESLAEDLVTFKQEWFVIVGNLRQIESIMKVVIERYPDLETRLNLQLKGLHHYLLKDSHFDCLHRMLNTHLEYDESYGYAVTINKEVKENPYFYYEKLGNIQLKDDPFISLVISTLNSY